MFDYLSRRTFLTTGAGFLALPVIAQLSACKGNEQAAPEKKIFSEPRFELLDLALQHEFGAIVQYSNHAGIIAALGQDPKGSVGKLIKEVIDNEVEHSILLTTILKKNGIEPTIAVWPPQTAATANEMIKKDIAAEMGAVKLYQQILTLDLDDQTKRIIETILQSEEMHHHIFTGILPEL